MKSFALLIQFVFFFSTSSIWAQSGTNPDGFLDLKWGISPDEAHKKLTERPGVVFKQGNADGSTFTGGSFAGHPILKWLLYFTGGKLTTAKACLIGGNNRHQLLLSVKKELTERYGAPKRVNKDSSCSWSFPPSPTHPIGESIELFEVGKNNEVVVVYSCQLPDKKTTTAEKKDL